MDALRSVAMLLVVVLHACLFLLPIDFWPVHDKWAYAIDRVQNPYSYLVLAIQGVAMPVFFLLSGFFTAMLWQSRGLHYLTQHRLKRIGLPLVVSMFTIVPMTAWLAGSNDVTLLSWCVAWLEEGLYHLWFLWYLLLLVAAFIIAIRLGLRFRHPLWWLLILLTLAPQSLMQQMAFGADTVADVLPASRVLGYYATFFFFGVFFFQRGIEVQQWWTVAVPLALFLVFPASLVALYRPEHLPGFDVAWTKWISTMLRITFTWLMCFGLMGCFRWLAWKERFWVRYMSDASYWLYLCHFPLVIVGQILVVSWPMNVHLKLVLIVVTVVTVLLALYQWSVRYTLIGVMLNGPRTRHYTLSVRQAER